MTPSVYQSLIESHERNKKCLAVLVDPDELRLDNLDNVVRLSENEKVDFLFIGGSLLLNDNMDRCLEKLKKECSIPLVLFPGNVFQVHSSADAILYLSLISGRNPDLLIGKHVVTAPLIKKAGLEVIPTGYMLVDGGNRTSVQYMSNTNPIPHDKDEIAACTAMAGMMLGLKTIYLDAGSGAERSVSNSMIKSVKESVDIPIIVGGGIRDAGMAFEKAKAGADLLVVGNAVEKDPSLIIEISAALKEAENSLVKRQT